MMRGGGFLITLLLSSLSLFLFSDAIRVPHQDGFSMAILHQTHPIIQTYLEKLNPQIVSGYSGISSGVFYMDLLVGTPPIHRFAVLDTGSRFTWLQVTNDYDSRKSSSYKAPRCKSNDDCADFMGGKCSPRKTCPYHVLYAGGEASDGEIGRDKFYFHKEGSWRDPNSLIPVEMVFGTALSTQLPVTGVCGLGDGNFGMLTVLGVYQFSVCFPKSFNMSGYIRFGKDAELLGKRTLLQRDNGHWDFYIASITIENTKLTNLSSSSVSGTRIIFDTGSSFTHLVPTAMDNFVTLLKQSGRRNVSSHVREGFEVCYMLDEVSAFKNLRVSFDVVVAGPIVLDFNNMWIKFDATDYCLAFKRSPWQFSIFGMRQMLGKNFGVDLTYSLFYIKEGC